MLANIIISSFLTHVEKDRIIDQVISNIKRNEIVALEMNTFNNETDNQLKQSNNKCMKALETENEHNEVKNSQHQIENQDSTKIISKSTWNKM